MKSEGHGRSWRLRVRSGNEEKAVFIAVFIYEILHPLISLKIN